MAYPLALLDPRLIIVSLGAVQGEFDRAGKVSNT